MQLTPSIEKQSLGFHLDNLSFYFCISNLTVFYFCISNLTAFYGWPPCYTVAGFGSLIYLGCSIN